MKKFIFTFINIIAATFAIISLSVLKVSFPDGNIAGILSAPIYQETDEFYNLINNRLDDVFTLITYKIPFESNGVLNYDKVIAESIDKNGKVKKWTIRDCIDSSVTHGYYIDTSFKMNKFSDSNTLSYDPNNTYNFMLKTYPSNKRTGSSTEEEFVTEVISALAEYYRVSQNLNNKSSNFRYNVTFSNDETDDTPIVYSNSNLTGSEMLDTDAFIYLSSKDGIISSNLGFINKQAMKNAMKKNPYPNMDFKLYCSLDTSFNKADEFAIASILYNQKKEFCGKWTTFLIISVTIFLISLFFTLFYILSEKKRVDDSQKVLFRIPTELYIVAYIMASISLIFLSNRMINSNTISNLDLASVKIYIWIYILYCTTILLFTVFSAKYANDSLTPIILKIARERESNKVTSTPPIILFIIVFLPVIVLLVLAFYLIYLYTLTNNLGVVISGVLILISTFFFIVYLLSLYNSFDEALKEQTNANEMRTSLIANVSHDIKTPLTSIISYTGLIAAEVDSRSKSSEKNLKHYSNVISDKANHLNDLINDLIFDSKVSTGSLTYDMQKVDLVEFITQVNTEFSEKLKEHALKVIFEHNCDKAYINVDSKQLYRVFQNLYSNIYKYALENSRVYIDLEALKSKVTVTLKNIQKEKLEVSVDTLKERFVRGNKSRTTEGFGLGLSITENLINAMNGKIEIKNVRDEFITKISFVLYED